MDGIIAGIKVVVIFLRAGFMLFLAAAGWQDFKSRRINVNLFWGFGAAGIILRAVGIILENRAGMHPLKSVSAAGGGIGPLMGNTAADVVAAAAIGILLLILSAVTEEAVGEGDGWFFAVSGVYLGFWRNLELLFGSLILCLVAGGLIHIMNRKKKRKADLRKTPLPFLALAVPVGLGVLLL